MSTYTIDIQNRTGVLSASSSFVQPFAALYSGNLLSMSVQLVTPTNTQDILNSGSYAIYAPTYSASLQVSVGIPNVTGSVVFGTTALEYSNSTHLFSGVLSITSSMLDNYVSDTGIQSWLEFRLINADNSKKTTIYQSATTLYPVMS